MFTIRNENGLSLYSILPIVWCSGLYSLLRVVTILPYIIIILGFARLVAVSGTFATSNLHAKHYIILIQLLSQNKVAVVPKFRNRRAYRGSADRSPCPLKSLLDGMSSNRFLRGVIPSLGEHKSRYGHGTKRKKRPVWHISFILILCVLTFQPHPSKWRISDRLSPHSARISCLPQANHMPTPPSPHLTIYTFM
jgi:hypothetical protein